MLGGGGWGSPQIRQLEVRGRDLSMTSGLETVSPTAMGQYLVWFEVVSLAIMLSVSGGSGLV